MNKERGTKCYSASTNSLWDVGKSLCATVREREERDERLSEPRTTAHLPSESGLHSVAQTQSRLSRLSPQSSRDCRESSLIRSFV